MSKKIETMTGYAAAKLVNQALKDAGVDKKIPAQMIYTYLKKGYIKSDGKGLVDTSKFAEWMEAYVAKCITKAQAQVDAEADATAEGVEVLEDAVDEVTEVTEVEPSDEELDEIEAEVVEA